MMFAGSSKFIAQLYLHMIFYNIVVYVKISLLIIIQCPSFPFHTFHFNHNMYFYVSLYSFMCLCFSAHFVEDDKAVSLDSGGKLTLCTCEICTV